MIAQAPLPAASANASARAAIRPTAVPHLAACGITKAYRLGKVPVPVLHGVDFAAERGEMVAVVGSSGSGKSTLLHCLGLLDSPDAGEVRLLGQRIDHVSARKRDALRNGTFGFIFQFYHLLPELSALENVMLPHMIRLGVVGYLRERRAVRAEALSLLERVGLGHRLHHKPTELSGGEMQRTAIARALVSRPDVLLADEPTGNLDAETGRSILGLLRDLNRERGLTMMMVTHDLAIAGQADRVVRLASGRIESYTPDRA